MKQIKRECADCLNRLVWIMARAATKPANSPVKKNLRTKSGDRSSLKQKQKQPQSKTRGSRTAVKATTKTTSKSTEKPVLDLDEYAPVTENRLPSLISIPLSDLPECAVQSAPLAVGKKLSPSVTFGHTPLSSAFRYIKPTWRHYIQYVDAAARSGDGEMKKYVQVWNSLSAREKQTHFPEQLCELSGVLSYALVAAVTAQVWLGSSAESSMALAFANPTMIHATAAYGSMQPEAFKDRELFFKLSGQLPTSKGGGGNGGGTNIFVGAQANANAAANSKSLAHSTLGDMSGLLDMDADTKENTKILSALESDGPAMEFTIQSDSDGDGGMENGENEEGEGDE